MTTNQPMPTEQPYLDRPPRIQPPLPIREIEIPPPPDKKGRSQGFVQLILPLMSIMGYSVMTVFGGRNILFMIPMALSVIGSISFSVYATLQEHKRIRELKTAYANRLRILRSEMESAHYEQRLYYEHTHPDMDTVSRIGLGEEQSRMGQRLWERRMNDHDFASLRLGIGDIPSQVVYSFKSGESLEDDPQLNEALQLAEDSQVIQQAPVIIPLRYYASEEEMAGGQRESATIYGRNSLGVSGETNQVIDVIRAFILQLSAFHAPTDFQIHVLGAPHAKDRWTWASWLPHTNTQQEYQGDRMCFEPPLQPDEDAKKTERMFPKRFLAQINKTLEERRLILEEDDSNEKTSAGNYPFLLLIVDNLPAVGGNIGTTDWLDSIVSEAAIASIFQQGQQVQAAIMFLVPENAKIPSECQSVYEIKVQKENYIFRYSEVGKNSPTYIGIADRIHEDEAEAFAKAIRDKRMRQSYGADLKTSVSILELFNTETVDGLKILEKWEQSKRKAKGNADWLRVSIGIRSGNDLHDIYFNQDYDGVHGMIAGTTGSGKSELLLTLIAGLAVTYDPSILNFVLVDYKGGSAFEPFRKLPHCVDIVTNLDGKAVDRMFVAIDAELRRRSKILADYNVKHIVEYREKGYHHKDPFPHLFIVVDEFAEMINENKEYKNRFDSITRLGRAIGVNLILATQRPSGVVSDQMRANMKLRICLRVETGDDSRELLGRGDAMFLPSGIPGRAYLQVGKDTPILIQVARAGGEYTLPSEADAVEDAPMEFGTYFDPKKKKATSNTNPETSSIVDVIVRETTALAANHSEKQHKPWPDPLPGILPLNHPIDATHLHTERNKLNNQIVLHPIIRAWLLLENGDTRVRERIDMWKQSNIVNWQIGDKSETQSVQNPLQATVGLIDIPSLAEQRILTLDLTQGPIILFGAGGWGKTTFLKTLLISLAATHSPDDLWIYVMDFARGGLEDLTDLPHLEEPIDVVEEGRVERLLRILANMLDERSTKIREVGSLIQYNARHPGQTLPAILVVIDNFAEFKETYENQLPQLTALIRDGRALGIYFVVTADQINAVPSKIYSLFTQRLSLKMADSADYQGIVGRAAHILTEVPGRGVISVDREPREFHIGVITEIQTNEKKQTTTISYQEDYNPFYTKIANLMRSEWNQPSPVTRVEVLSQHIELLDIYQTTKPLGFLAAAIGIRDIDRQTAWLELGGHCLVLGPPLSGKTSLLQSLILSFAERYSPDNLGMILIDPRRSLFDYRLIYPNAQNQLGALTHVLKTASEAEDLDTLQQYLQVELYPDIQQRVREHAAQLGVQNPFLDGNPQNRHLVIIIDNYDDMGDLERPRFIENLSDMVRKYRNRVHLIVCGTPELLRRRDAIIKRVETSRYALVLQSVETIRDMGGKVSYNLNNAELSVGRGLVFKSGRTQLFQAARFSVNTPDESYASVLDQYINQQNRNTERLGWYYRGSETLLNNTLLDKNVVIEHEQQSEEFEISDEAAAHREQLMKKFLKTNENRGN
ncbi:MAG: AAA family ATPase [Anaerolineaceae bacterium]|nr:AAA family ATPase [Anaerolineaceae bacterium]